MAAVVNNNIPNFDFNKTQAMFNMKFLRTLLMIITAILIVLSLIMMSVGNVAYWYYHVYAFFLDSEAMKGYIAPAGLFTFTGTMLLLVAAFGFYGSYRKSTCMVNLYAITLFVLLIMKLVAIFLAYTFDRSAIWQYMDIPVWSVNDPETQAEVDYLQSSLGCCGSTYYTDYDGIELPINMSTVLVTIPESPSILSLPTSCCINIQGEFCSHIWLYGCKHMLLSTLDANAVTIGVLGVSVMVMNLMGIIFALLLARSIRNMKSEKGLMTWKIKEQIIFARQAEDMHTIEQNQVNQAQNDRQADMV